MSYKDILYEVTEPVATITFNRPEVMNALSPDTEAELYAALDEADVDDSVRVIILTGAGRAFSSGYDIGGRRPDGGDTPDAPEAAPKRRRRPTFPDPPGEIIQSWWRNDLDNIQKLMHLAYLHKPVIAAVNGWCLGGGFWYALISDITIASENAVFGQPEVRMIANTSYLLVALCGWKVASRFALTGDHIDAAEALRVGIVNEVVPHDQLMARAMQLAQRIAMVPEPAVRYAKAVTFLGLEAAGLRSGLVVNAALSSLVHSSWIPERAVLEAAMENGGLQAFLKERDDRFRPEPFGPRSKPKSD